MVNVKAVSAMIIIVLAIIITGASLVTTEWNTVSKDKAVTGYGLFQVCTKLGSIRQCKSYKDATAAKNIFGSDLFFQQYYRAMRIAAAMLCLAVLPLLVALVLLVLSLTKHKRYFMLIATALCILPVILIGIGLGIYHQIFTNIHWIGTAPSIGASFGLACVASIVCIVGAILAVFAYREGGNTRAPLIEEA